jgi:hypothetical protein
MESKETTKTAKAPVPKIYAAIVGVMAEVGVVGKNSKNTQQNFMYRGIDAVMNALQPAMIKNKVFVVPTVLSEQREERQTTKGGVLFYTRLRVRYDFYAEDGSSVSAEVIGEAMDSGDKATNKAMSIAYKYACFQVFCIPTEEMKDPDAECHDVAPQQEVVYVDEIKIKVLKERMEQKGVKDNQIFERYGVTRFAELTVADFMKACSGLDKMPDVESKQVDLGL